MSLSNKFDEFNHTKIASRNITLDDVTQSMVEWRANKKASNESIPDEIWKNIFSLLNKFPEPTLCGALGISKIQFQHKLHELQSGTSISNNTTSARVDFCEVKETPSTLYKPLKIPATNTLVVEFCRADGRIMKIHTTTDSFSELMKSFFSGA